MENLWGRDRWRQAANVAGAIFQLAITVFAAARIDFVVNSGPRSPIEPADYAFTIWTLIFPLSLAYAVYQAMPKNREDQLHRQIGWYTAGAFSCTGLWSVFVPESQTLAALGVFLIAWGCLFIAYRRIVQVGPGASDGLRWLVALPIGVFFAWTTAADLVSIHSELVFAGVLPPGSMISVAVAAALLIGGGILGALIVASGRRGPIQAYLGYGATVLWALFGVVASQWGTEPVTTAAAGVAAVSVAVTLLRIFPFQVPPRRSPGHVVGSTAR